MNVTVASPVSAADIFSWPITSEVTSIRTELDGQISIPHTKAGNWPITFPFGDATAAEGSIWGIFKIGSEWVAGTIDWLRPGQVDKKILPADYGPGFKTIYNSYTGPAPNEIVGYFVSTTARFDSRTINERSNIAWVKFGTSTQVASPLEEQPMKLPDDVKLLISVFVEKFPFPRTNDEEASAWTHKLCEQLAYSFPTSGWCHKSAGPGRPHSADVIALKVPFIGWDIIYSAGSPEAKLNLDADSIELTGQIPEPVAPYNYFETAPPVEPPIPPPVEPPSIPTDTQLLMQILKELKIHTEYFKAMSAGFAALPAQLQDVVSKGIKIRF